MRPLRFIVPGFLAFALVALFSASLALLLLVQPTPAGAQGTFTVRYVATTGTDFGNTCVDPANPCRTIQHAVDVANPGDEIRVATGVYTHTLQRNGITQSVYISKSLFLRGGYTTTNWAGAPVPNPEENPVIIKPFAGRGIVITPTVTTVISPSPTVLIEAVEVFGGNAAGLGGDPQNADAGGGIYAVSATVTLIDVGVVSNTAQVGGGLYARDSFVDMRFGYVMTNTASAGCGGGIFVANSADGSMFRNLRVGDNRSSVGRGGGVCLVKADRMMWESAELFGNESYSDGGAMWIDNSRELLLRRLYVYGNRSQMFGGGGIAMWGSTATLQNLLLVDNAASPGSGTALVLNESDVELFHATVVRHKSTTPGAGLMVEAGSTLTATNTILVGHDTGIRVTPGSRAIMTATLWGAGMWANTTNWSVDPTATLITGTINIFDMPGFIDPSAGDFHLLPTSPAVDAGVLTPVLIDGDYEPRPIGPAPDLGVDEVPYTDVDPSKDTTFVYTDTTGITMTVNVPSKSITQSLKLAIIRRDRITERMPAKWRVAGLAFDMDAFMNGSRAESYRFQVPITLTVTYRDEDLNGVAEETLLVQFWDRKAQRWKDIAEDCGTTYRRFPITNTLEVGVCHLSRFALMGIDTPLRLYLPAVVR